MKKEPITADACADRFRATADALLREGATQETLVEALVIVALEAGRKSRRAEAIFDAEKKVFGNAAYVAFEGAGRPRRKAQEASGYTRRLSPFYAVMSAYAS